MRILLATAVAIAPLLAATGVQAEVVISTTRTTPITTSNATGSGPDIIRIASGGSITVNSGTALTLNSSHDVTIDGGGSITMLNAADGATGVLVNGGNTADLTISGGISITDNIDTYPNTDSDSDLDGPFSNGTDRYGVRVVGSAPLVGDIRMTRTSAINVDGNNSYGISVESDLTGNLTTLGTVSATGDNSVGIRVSGDVSGQTFIGGNVTGYGRNASAVTITGQTDGPLIVQGQIQASGYRYTSRPGQTVIDALEADDLYQGGTAVLIAGNVAGGVVFDEQFVGTVEADTDEDDDGVIDTEETTARITSFGAAPAVQIGSTSQAVTIGAFGTGASDYGFINRGEIGAQGVYDGITANGVVFGVTGGQAVNIEGGVLNDGSISALSYQAAATAIRFGDGTTTPRFANSGTLSTGVSADTNVVVANVVIEDGANVPSFVNSGQMIASSVGGVATVVGLQDLSGTLTSITNTRSIQTQLLPNEDGDALTGTTTAIDVRANTTGVTFVQSGVANAPTAGDPDTDGDGVSNAFEPIVVGDILLGSGNDVVDIRNGTVNGTLNFGVGQDSLSISGGANVRSAIVDADGLLDVSVTNGSLETLQSTPATISGLTIGQNGQLLVSLDPQAGANAGFVVNGTATLQDGAQLGVRFSSLLDGPERFTIIDATTLNYGNVQTDGVDEPYLFVTTVGADVAAGNVYVDARRRTAQEANLLAVEASAFDAFYDALDRDDALLNAFLSQTDREGFIDLYEQLLPDHSGGPLLSLASGVDAVTRALTGRNASAQPGETSAWLQEINFYADKDKTDTYGFRSEGFGVAGGVERGTDLGAFGVTVAFTSSDLEDPEAEAEEILSANLIELGVYWRAQGQYWTTWARAAAGYATFDATRSLVGSGLNLSNESSWNGVTLAAAGGASYERTYGRFTLRPEVYAEYFSLSEDARVEDGGGDAFDLEIDERDGHIFSAVAAMNVSFGLGENSWLRPEFRVGWRQNISVDVGETIARFASGGPDFRLSPDSIEGGGPIVGFRLNVGNELGMLSISADAEQVEDYIRYMLLLRASFRF
jgi:hypothetical protein